MTMTARIEALRSEAAVAGDLEMVRLCDDAIDHGEDSAAWRECERVLADAEAIATVP